MQMIHDIMMPSQGEVWRHYKGDLYAIVGMSRDHKGRAIVVYVKHDDSGATLLGRPLFNQPIGRFLQEIENGQPRFTLTGIRSDNEMPF